jgi:hypothetical protein
VAENSGGHPKVGWGTYVGSVRDGIIYKNNGSQPKVAWGTYVGTIRDGIVYKDRGSDPKVALGEYVGSGQGGGDEDIAAAALLLGLL